MGLHRRGSISRHSAAPAGQRTSQRSTARGAGDARFDDRDQAAVTYQSQADLGGQEGHGAVIPEAEGDLFHADWERTALAVTLAMGATGTWNIDESRGIRETLPGYSSLTYYEI